MSALPSERRFATCHEYWDPSSAGLGRFGCLLGHRGLDHLRRIEQVYDLTVPDLHNFIANDICLHNTAFGLGLAAYAAFSEKKPTLFFSLEMGYLELIQRMLAFEADVDGQVLKGKRKLTEDEQARVNAANKRFMESPLFIYNNPNVTLPTIRSMCRQVKARTGELGLVVIDYIQLIQGHPSPRTASKRSARSAGASESWPGN